MALGNLADDDPRRIAGYSVIARIGQGGMGVVYLARSDADEQLVALKTIRRSVASDPAYRQRFRREVTAAGRVTSRYAARLVDADPDGDPPWLAAEFIDAGSLQLGIERHGPMRTSHVADLGYKLAAALADIHACGTVHRDLTPANVMLAEDGPRIIDFGIARQATDATLTNADAVIGTLAVMSPERLRGHDAGPAADVWSLGCVLTYAATGRYPFGAGAEAMARALEQPPDLREVSPPLYDVIERCLSKDAAARPTPQRIQDMLTAPGGSAVPETVPYVPATPGYPSTRPGPPERQESWPPAPVQPPAPAQAAPPGLLSPFVPPAPWPIATVTTGGSYAPTTGGGIGSAPTELATPGYRTVPAQAPPPADYSAPWAARTPPPAPAWTGGGGGAGTGEERGLRRGPWRRRPLLALGAVVAVAALATAAAFTNGLGLIPQASSWQAPSGEEWQQVAQAGSGPSQCVGITAGAHDFGEGDPVADSLMALAGSVNAAIGDRPYITVVLVATLTPQAPSGGGRLPATGAACGTAVAAPNPAAGAPHCPASTGFAPPTDLGQHDANVADGISELRGVLLAVCRHNADPTSGPAIRLLVANAGASEAYAGQIAGSIIADAATDKTLAGVVGLSQSQSGVFDAAARLNQAGIPMVVSTPSADQLTGVNTTTRPYPYLFRIAPSNDREAEVLKNFVVSQHRDKPCVIEATGDQYSESLAYDFNYWWQTVGQSAPVQTYADTATPTPGMLAGTAAAPATCGPAANGSPPPYDAIIFTGREADIPAVLGQMHTWGYPSSVPVIGGDDVSGLVSDATLVSDYDVDQRTVYFPDFGFTSPQEWSDASLQREFQPFAAGYKAIIGNSPLSGHVSVSFDAAWVFAAAIGTVNGNAATAGVLGTGGPGLRTAIRNALAGDCGSAAVRGATGLISFDTKGDPMAKLVLIESINPQGQVGDDIYSNGVFTQADLTAFVHTHPGQIPTGCHAT